MVLLRYSVFCIAQTYGAPRTCLLDTHGPRSIWLNLRDCDVVDWFFPVEQLDWRVGKVPDSAVTQPSPGTASKSTTQNMKHCSMAGCYVLKYQGVRGDIQTNQEIRRRMQAADFYERRSMSSIDRRWWKLQYWLIYIMPTTLSRGSSAAFCQCHQCEVWQKIAVLPGGL